jgi:hypothetical protein
MTAAFFHIDPAFLDAANTLTTASYKEVFELSAIIRLIKLSTKVAINGEIKEGNEINFINLPRLCA